MIPTLTTPRLALRDRAPGPCGLSTVVSYFDPANAAALSLARRLGGRPDGALSGCTIRRHHPRQGAIA